MRRLNSSIEIGLVVAITVGAFCFCHVKAHPLIFNESMWQRAHCMP